MCARAFLYWTDGNFLRYSNGEKKVATFFSFDQWAYLEEPIYTVILLLSIKLLPSIHMHVKAQFR